MKYCQDNWEDLKRYFEKTFVKFPLLGDEVVYVDRVTENGMSGKRFHSDEFEMWEYSWEGESIDEALDISFIPPTKSYFEWEGNVYFLCRSPQRQYKRGITSDNISIACFMGYGEFGGVGISSHLINAYTAKPQFHPFSTTDTPYVVTSRIAVDASGNIYVDKTHVGVYNKEKGIISCTYSLFLPELETALRSHGQQDIQIRTKAKRKPK